MGSSVTALKAGDVALGSHASLTTVDLEKGKYTLISVHMQISLGKTRSVPLCLNGLMTSHFSAIEPRDALRGVLGIQGNFVDKICEKMIVKKCSQTYARLHGRKCGTGGK